MERRKKEQQEREEYEARIKEERQLREVELCRIHCERSASLVTLCMGSLASWAVQHWQLKQVRCRQFDSLMIDRLNLMTLCASESSTGV